MFETIAFLSTITMVVIFVALFMMDRAARQNDAADQSNRPAPPGR